MLVLVKTVLTWLSPQSEQLCIFNLASDPTLTWTMPSLMLGPSTKRRVRLGEEESTCSSAGTNLKMEWIHFRKENLPPLEFDCLVLMNFFATIKLFSCYLPIFLHFFQAKFEFTSLCLLMLVFLTEVIKMLDTIYNNFTPSISPDSQSGSLGSEVWANLNQEISSYIQISESWVKIF